MHKQQVAANTNNKIVGIETILPIPHHPHINSIEIAMCVDEVEGGMKGVCQEKPTNMHEVVTKGGSLTHVLHKVVHTDHRLDLRASASPSSVQHSQNIQKYVNKNHKGQKVDTGQVQNDLREPIDQNMGTGQVKNNFDPPGKGSTGNLQEHNEAQMQTPNNKSQGKISTNHKSYPQGKTHKSADKSKDQSRVHDEYNVVPSKDEFDQYTQSLGENDNEEDETSNHLIKAFGSTLHQEELQEVTNQ
ncbi:hypothetical protein KY290_036521 [Solanum tuberosum]|uniref:Bifunctional endo-1,4-beta-xylanase xylA n=1 Tax=Solanum tuberosum TaxID=4113 RepID=A0ABQ7TSY3_SOLTU|nr:hypothetical protein KY290_036521 [Solanum tuberosum]